MAGMRHENQRKIMYACRFQLTKYRAEKIFVNGALLDQLDACKGDEERRLILGISQKTGKDNRVAAI